MIERIDKEPILIRLVYYAGISCLLLLSLWLVLLIKNFIVGDKPLGVDGLIALFLVSIPLMHYYDKLFSWVFKNFNKNEPK